MNSQDHSQTCSELPLDEWALTCLLENVPQRKIACVQMMGAQLNRPVLELSHSESACEIPRPGLPEELQLVAPSALRQRKLSTQQGRIALIHAVAHIEFNAINLALDAVYRFPDMPEAFYRDWISVAVDEARHFQMLATRLRDYDSAYGTLPAHNGLWEMALKTQHDCLARMALVPRVLEARGLDVTPGMMERVKQAGDQQTVEILSIILEEEERHVAIGSHWFRYCCEKRGVDPESTFLDLIEQYYGTTIRGPFNHPARKRAGFSTWEMDALTQLAESHR